MCKQLLFDMLLNTKYLSVKNITIILIELMYMYIVLVPFNWTRALSPVCFLFVHSSINFCVFDPFSFKEYLKLLNWLYDITWFGSVYA